MTFAKLKAKNQLTIPSAIVKRLRLRAHELFAIDVKKNYIKLIPVELKPRYTAEELKAIDNLVEKEKPKAEKIRAGKDFSAYVKKLTQ